jgi:hypothetical protein
MSQTFSRARLELRPTLADTAVLVQPADLGSTWLETHAPDEINYTLPVAARSTGHHTERYLQPVPLGTASLFFEETGYGLIESFLLYWRIYGGADVFGYPISEEFTARGADGQLRTMQHFERATLAYYPEEDQVRLEPLGWQMLMLEHVRDPRVEPQVR